MQVYTYIGTFGECGYITTILYGSRVNDLFDVKIFDAHTQNRVLIIILYYETLKI